jgi:peptidase E
MGGRPWVAADGGQALVGAMLRYYPVAAKVAFCNFAQPESDWQETQHINSVMFDEFRGATAITYQTMNSSNFTEVSAWADVIYIPGGTPAILKQKLNAFPDLAQLWDNKVVAGASAGADVLCAYYPYLQDKTIQQGFGWVAASLVPHWRNDGEDEHAQTWAEAELLKRHPELPVLCIPEGEFVEITVQ